MLKISNLIRLSAIVALGLFVQGCKADLNDLKLEKLSLVEVSPKTDSEMDFGRYVSRDGDLFRLRVDITSDRDVWKLIKDQHYLLKVDTFFCKEPKKNVLIDTGVLYWKGQDVMSKSLDLDSPIEREQPGEKTYSVYLSVYSPAVPSFRKSQEGKQFNEYEAYDLVKKAEDVCLTVNSRTMVGGFKSNTVRIPKSLIRDELKKVVLAE
ncbi:hypothetical protein ACJJI5_05975 [Microbulbifer sp. EKSA008]|uniref:hypothetical protein n=1 Tax=Microbulbifer sp. EKSA008 TaxID=3243367 RepID=UPI00404387F3